MKPQALYSLENEQWMSIRKSADAVMHQTIAAGYMRHNIAFRATEHGVEIAAYSREHILKFCDGLKSVQKALEVRNIDFDQATGRTKELANLGARSQTKRIASLGSVQKMWLKRAQEAGVLLFAASDKRLEATHAQRTAVAMTPSQAIDAALDRAASTEKRFHGEFAVLREAIRESGYATPHAEILSEITRRMNSGELVHTQSGILRREEAVQVASMSYLQAVDASRAALLADAQESLSAEVSGFEHSTPSSASPQPMTDAQRQAVLLALSSGSTAEPVYLPSASSAEAVACVLAELASEHGLKPVVLSDTPASPSSVGFAAGVAASSSLNARCVLILAVDVGTSPGAVTAIKSAADRANAVVIELSVAPRLKVAMAPPRPKATDLPTTAAVESDEKLRGLSTLARKHVGALKAVVAALRSDTAQVRRTTLKQ